MKSAVIIALLGYTQAQVANADNGYTQARSVWVQADPKYKNVMDKQCKNNMDCSEGFVCASHMWEYNTQTESARGCWNQSVCAQGSFDMMDGRRIQFFCDAEDMKDQGPVTYAGLTPAKEQFWKEWEVTCETHQDCWDKSGNQSQLCTPFIWDGDESGNSYGSGTACYNYDDPNKCAAGSDTPSFATVNENYKNTQFSYFTQQWCAANEGDMRSADGMMNPLEYMGMDPKDMGGLSIEMGEGEDGNWIKITMGAITTLATVSAATISAAMTL